MRATGSCGVGSVAIGSTVGSVAGVPSAFNVGAGVVFVIAASVVAGAASAVGATSVIATAAVPRIPPTVFCVPFAPVP